MTASREMFTLRLPADVRDWIRREAGERRMTMTELTLRLLAKGIQAESLDESVARLEGVLAAPHIAQSMDRTRAGLREVLATRYMVEQIARGAIATPETIGFDANRYADRELGRLWPLNEEGLSK